VALIAAKLQGRAVLAWCAACRAFRAVQPPLRVLTIDYHDEDCSNGLIHPCMQSQLRIHVRKTDYNAEMQCHRIIESISARHASEITHLYMNAIHPCPPDRPLRALDAIAHGVQLTALRVLHIQQHGCGFTGDGPDSPHNTLSYCNQLLILSVAATLRTLSITAFHRFAMDDVVALLSDMGGQLHYLAIDLRDRTHSGPTATARVHQEARLRCRSLRVPAQIRCHQVARGRWSEFHQDFVDDDWNPAPPDAELVPEPSLPMDAFGSDT
jgi:hypothetical protein